MIFQSLAIILSYFFDLKDRNYLSHWAKNRKSARTFGAMSMMNKCVKFHGDLPSG